MANSPKIPSFRPMCKNHSVPLEGCGFPMPAKGRGKCPISGAEFEFEAEVDQTKMGVDKFGQPYKSVGWRVKGQD